MSTWVEGEIVEVLGGGRQVLVRPLRLMSQLRGDDSELLRERLPIQLELGYARGWIYFDSPDGDTQERVILRAARHRFRPGQLIEIGRASRFRGGVERRSARMVSPGSAGAHDSEFRFEGYVMVRITPFRED